MFTIFHLILLAGLGTGFALGLAVGARLFGVVGGIVGALAGSCLGLVVGQIPLLLMLRSLARDLTARTSPELRALLRSADCRTPNLVLLELRSRGEDIRQELPAVLDLLVSAEMDQRSLGWAALTSAFPELVTQIPEYRFTDSVEDCRRKTEGLRGAR